MFKTKLSQNEAANVEADQLLLKITEYGRIVADLQSQIATKDEEIESVHQEMKSKVVEAKQTISALINIVDLQNRAAKLGAERMEAQLQKLKEEAVQIKAEKSTMSSQLATFETMEADVVSLREDNAKQTASRLESERIITNLHSQMTANDEKSESVHQQMQSQLEEAEQTISALNKRVSDSEEALKKQKAAMEIEVERLNAEILKIEEQHSTENQAAKTRHETMKGDVVALREDNTKQADRMEAEDRVVDGVNSEISTMRKRSIEKVQQEQLLCAESQANISFLTWN